MSDIGAILETGGAAAVEYAAAHIVEQGGRTTNCANCREPLIGPFCAVCGQPRDVHRRSVWVLLHDLFRDTASFDSRILRTTRALMLQPGELARAYREGRTQPFVPPVRLYLFVTLLFFVTLSFSHLALVQFEMVSRVRPVQIDAKGHPYVMEDGERTALSRQFAAEKRYYTFNPATTFFTRLGSRHSQMTPEAIQRLDARTKIGAAQGGSWVEEGINGAMRKLAFNPAALNGAITEWVPRVLFALLPLFAMLLALFHWRRRRDFFLVDHLVFSLNFHSFGFALLLLAAGAAQFLPGGTVAWGVVLLLGLYLLLALRRVYGQGWAMTGVKFAAIGFVYSMFFIFPAFVVILALSVFDGGTG